MHLIIKILYLIYIIYDSITIIISSILLNQLNLKYKIITGIWISSLLLWIVHNLYMIYYDRILYKYWLYHAIIQFTIRLVLVIFIIFGDNTNIYIIFIITLYIIDFIIIIFIILYIIHTMEIITPVIINSD